jgi:hypothetical protein
MKVAKLRNSIRDVWQSDEALIYYVPKDAAERYNLSSLLARNGVPYADMFNEQLDAGEGAFRMFTVLLGTGARIAIGPDIRVFILMAMRLGMVIAGHSTFNETAVVDIDLSIWATKTSSLYGHNVPRRIVLAVSGTGKTHWLKNHEGIDVDDLVTSRVGWDASRHRSEASNEWFQKRRAIMFREFETDEIIYGNMDPSTHIRGGDRVCLVDIDQQTLEHHLHREQRPNIMDLELVLENKKQLLDWAISHGVPVVSRFQDVHFRTTSDTGPRGLGRLIRESLVTFCLNNSLRYVGLGDEHESVFTVRGRVKSIHFNDSIPLPSRPDGQMFLDLVDIVTSPGDRPSMPLPGITLDDTWIRASHVPLLESIEDDYAHDSLLIQRGTYSDSLGHGTGEIVGHAGDFIRRKTFLGSTNINFPHAYDKRDPVFTGDLVINPPFHEAQIYLIATKSISPGSIVVLPDWLDNPHVRFILGQFEIVSRAEAPFYLEDGSNFTTRVLIGYNKVRSNMVHTWLRGGFDFETFGSDENQMGQWRWAMKTLYSGFRQQHTIFVNEAYDIERHLGLPLYERDFGHLDYIGSPIVIRPGFGSFDLEDAYSMIGYPQVRVLSSFVAHRPDQYFTLPIVNLVCGLYSRDPRDVMAEVPTGIGLQSDENLISSLNIIRRDLFTYRYDSGDLPVMMFSISNVRNNRLRILSFLSRLDRFVAIVPNSDIADAVVSDDLTFSDGVYNFTSLGFQDHGFSPDEFTDVNIYSMSDFYAIMCYDEIGQPAYIPHWRGSGTWPLDKAWMVVTRGIREHPPIPTWANDQTFLIKYITGFIRRIWRLDNSSLHVLRRNVLDTLGGLSVNDARLSGILRLHGKYIRIAISGHMVNMLLACHWSTVDFRRYLATVEHNMLHPTDPAYKFFQAKNLWLEPAVGRWHGLMDWVFAIDVYRLYAEIYSLPISENRILMLLNMLKRVRSAEPHSIYWESAEIVKDLQPAIKYVSESGKTLEDHTVADDLSLRVIV